MLKKIIKRDAGLLASIIIISGLLISSPLIYNAIDWFLVKIKINGKEYFQYSQARPMIHQVGIYGCILLAFGYPIALIIRFINRASTQRDEKKSR